MNTLSRRSQKPDRYIPGALKLLALLRRTEAISRLRLTEYTL